MMLLCVYNPILSEILLDIQVSLKLYLFLLLSESGLVWLICLTTYQLLVQSAGAIEYTDCFSAEG